MAVGLRGLNLIEEAVVVLVAEEAAVDLVAEMENRLPLSSQPDERL